MSALALLAVALPVRASCWHEAAARYQVSPALLYAIAKQESALKPDAVSALNSDGSYDIGLMQINSKWHAVADDSMCKQIPRPGKVMSYFTRSKSAGWDNSAA